MSSDELANLDKPVSSVDFLDNGSSALRYTENDTLSAVLTKSEEPVSPSEFVIGNDTEAGEVPNSFDYPDNKTDITLYDDRKIDPVGNGASLASKENVSANTDDGTDYRPVDYELPSGHGPEMPSESEDVLDSTLTSAKGAYHVEGKILYAPGDYSWKLRLKIEHNCENGTIK
ncbi:hypothetical protein AAVH_34280, partial [Aphelenchoides avenae]